jgi:hypothetical protein
MANLLMKFGGVGEKVLGGLFSVGKKAGSSSLGLLGGVSKMASSLTGLISSPMGGIMSIAGSAVLLLLIKSKGR